MAKKVKTQMQLYREVEKKIGDANRLFLELVADGLTRRELQTLIDKRPALWGRFSGWLSTLPGEEVKPDDAVRKDWHFVSDSLGYMLYYKGVPQGGARSSGTKTKTSDGKRRHWRHIEADRKMHFDTAKSICDRNNAEGKVGKL